MAKDDKDAVPAGSKIQDNSPDDLEGLDVEETADESKGSDDVEVKGSEGEDKKGASAPDSETAKQLSGKTTEELLAIIEEGQKQIGKQANEVGELRKMVGEMQKTGAKDENTAPDFDAQLNDVLAQVEDGKLTMTEALRQTYAIAQGSAKELTKAELEQAAAKQQAETASQQFLSENEDFHDVVKSEDVQKLIASSPIFDEFSAYERVKRTMAESELEKTRARVAELEKEREEMIKNGAQVASKVGKAPGVEVRTAQTTKTRPRGRADMRAAKQSALAALERVRTSG